MNGAESLVATLINNGVEVCFTNPGTSEMHMVAAIGKTDGMRSILGLFEGICTGAADGRQTRLYLVAPRSRIVEWLGEFTQC
jgi:acetolactate synthase I/II/III large subunit